eukprot:5113474-Prymnesium_polylepis.3
MNEHRRGQRCVLEHRVRYPSHVCNIRGRLYSPPKCVATPEVGNVAQSAPPGDVLPRTASGVDA